MEALANYLMRSWDHCQLLQGHTRGTQAGSDLPYEPFAAEKRIGRLDFASLRLNMPNQSVSWPRRDGPRHHQINGGPSRMQPSLCLRRPSSLAEHLSLPEQLMGRGGQSLYRLPRKDYGVVPAGNSCRLLASSPSCVVGLQC